MARRIVSFKGKTNGLSFETKSFSSLSRATFKMNESSFTMSPFKSQLNLRTTPIRSFSTKSTKSTSSPKEQQKETKASSVKKPVKKVQKKVEEEEEEEEEEEGADNDAMFQNFSELQKQMEGDPSFSKLMKSFQKQVDKEARVNWREGVQPPVRIPGQIKPFPQNVETLKVGVEKEIGTIPPAGISPRPGWKLENSTLMEEEVPTPVGVLSHLDEFREVKITFPLEGQEDVEDEEAEGEEGAEETGEEGEDFNMKSSGPHELTHEKEQELSTKLKTHSANIDVTFFDSLKNPKGTLTLQCTIESDNNFYVQSMRTKSGETFLSIDMMKATPDFNETIYDFLDGIGIGQDTAVLIRRHVEATDYTNRSQFLHTILKFLEK